MIHEARSPIVDVVLIHRTGRALWCSPEAARRLLTQIEKQYRSSARERQQQCEAAWLRAVA